MQRYFIHEMNDEENVIVSGDDFHHMTRVMRMETGDQFMGVINAKTALIQIDTILDESLRGRIIEWVDESVEMPVQVSIANGLPKGDKLEWVIQKGTELGAHALSLLWQLVPLLNGMQRKPPRKRNGCARLQKRRQSNRIVRSSRELTTQFHLRDY